MLLSCRLSSPVPMAVDQPSVSVLSGATGEIQLSCTSARHLAHQAASPYCMSQACLSSLSLPVRKSVAGATIGHSSFFAGLSLRRKREFSNGSRWSATWLENKAQVEVDVPISEAWELWSDREGIYRWMPWIHSVKVLDDKPELSRWTLKYTAFGQDLEFSWLSRNLKPTYHQKIHWRSVDGHPNRGVVRFYPRSPTSCAVQLTISYEVPQVLSGVASALSPLVDSIIQQDLDRFAKFAKSNQLESTHK